MRAELWGPEHEELGEIASAAAGERAAVAISRGRYPKSYHYVDANEDVAAAVAGPRATLLLVCDGHNGALAAVRAGRMVLEELGEDPPPEVEWLPLFDRVNQAVREEAAVAESSSRTVLLVALVAGRSLTWGAMGDAALVLARPGAARGRQLNREEARYVGSPTGRRGLREIDQGRVELDGDEWIVLATDGLAEFIAPMRPADAVPRVLARASAAGAPATAARAIVDTACEAGAGDNVAVALLAPPPQPGRAPAGR